MQFCSVLINQKPLKVVRQPGSIQMQLGVRIACWGVTPGTPLFEEEGNKAQPAGSLGLEIDDIVDFDKHFN